MQKSFPTLGDVDIRLLRVFCAVVECGGFTQAQQELNVSRSTISTHMANLETRLGFKLCHRGRAGFSITPRGRAVHEASLGMFDMLEGFNSQIAQLRESIVGEIAIGIVDNMITNVNCRLSSAIEKVMSQTQDLRITIRVVPPDQLEELLVSRRLQMALVPQFMSRREITQKVLFNETQSLYCGACHPLFEADESEITPEIISRQEYVRRGYVSALTPYSLPFSGPSIAVSHNMEGLAHFILSGQCVGFLPDGYAKYWVERNKMRILRPDLYRFEVPICATCAEHDHQSLAAAYVYDAIIQEHAGGLD